MSLDQLDDLTPAEAAVVVAGMRAVAEADGDVHERELELINQLGEGLEAADPHTALASAEARALYLKSCAMVALADGVLSSVECTVIRTIGAAQGFGGDEVDAILRDVKREFFSVFAGVKHFRDQAVAIGESLGLDRGEIDNILDA